MASYRKWLSEERNTSTPLKPSNSLIELVRPITRDTSRHNVCMYIHILALD